jgi:hypothetical protein
MLRRPGTRRERRERFLELRRLTAGLRPFVAGRYQQARQDLADCERRLRVQALLQRRDYAFVLYPEALLREFFAPFRG